MHKSWNAKIEWCEDWDQTAQIERKVILVKFQIQGIKTVNYLRGCSQVGHFKGIKTVFYLRGAVCREIRSVVSKKHFLQSFNIFHISTKYIYWVSHRVTTQLLVMSCLFPPLISALPPILLLIDDFRMRWKRCIEQGDRFHVTFQVALHECALAERIGGFLQLPCKAFW